MSARIKPEYRLAKKLPGRSQLARVRAARAMIDGVTPRQRRRMELHAFMAIFHPEVTTDRINAMLSED